MLPNHAPLVIAEQFGMLEALHPGPDRPRHRAGARHRPAHGRRRCAAAPAAAEPTTSPTSSASCSASSTARSPTTTRTARSPPCPASGYQPAIWLLGSSDYSARLAGAARPAVLVRPPLRRRQHRCRRSPSTGDAFRPSVGARRAVRDARRRGALRRHRRAGPVARRSRATSSFLRLRPGRPGRFPTPEEAAEFHPTPAEKEAIKAWSSSRIVGDPAAVRDQLDAPRRPHRRRRADGHDDGPRPRRPAPLLRAPRRPRRPPAPVTAGTLGPCPKATRSRRRRPGCGRRCAGHVLTRFEAPRLRGPIAGARHRGRPASRRGASTCSCTSPTASTLRTHLRMTGSWHVYRERERWQKPAYLARAVVGTDSGWVGGVLPGAGGGDLPAGRRRARPRWPTLGPDLCLAGVARADDVLDEWSSAVGRLRRPGGHARRGAARPAHRGRHRQRLQVRGLLRLPARPHRARSAPFDDDARRRVWEVAARQLQANLDRPEPPHPPAGPRRLRPARPALPRVRHARSAWPATAT